MNIWAQLNTEPGLGSSAGAYERVEGDMMHTCFDDDLSNPHVPLTRSIV